MSTTTTPTKWTVDTLADAFVKARDAALAADPGGAEDMRGSCNLDNPTICLPRVKDATVQEAAQRAGISVTKMRWLGRQRYFVNTPVAGQGYRRGCMTEAADKSL